MKILGGKQDWRFLKGRTSHKRETIRWLKASEKRAARREVAGLCRSVVPALVDEAIPVGRAVGWRS